MEAADTVASESAFASPGEALVAGTVGNAVVLGVKPTAVVGEADR